jgi:hypothetical protein
MSGGFPTVATLGTPSSTSVTGTVSASTSSAIFTPDLLRSIWVHTWGTWTGTVQLMRSTNGGLTWYPITTSSGTVKGQWTTNVNAAITEETCIGAVYQIQFTWTSGTMNYEIRQ